MSELGLEEQFSILFVLPDTFPYRERTFSDADLDAAELDYMHLKATGELLLPLEAAASEPGRVLTAVIPCAAAFYHFPRVATSRADLAGSEQSSPRQCGRYNHIILRDDGTLTSSQPGAIGNLFGSWGQPVRGTRATAASVGYGLSELRVETRKQGVKAFVRGTITLTPTGGYVIDAPKTFNDAGSDLDGVSAVGSTAVVENNGLAWPRVRINVLQHAIVDDLVAMGVVSSAPDALPVLLSEPGTSRDVYNVLVSTSHIKEVEGRVGPSFESRIVQVCSVLFLMIIFIRYFIYFFMSHCAVCMLDHSQRQQAFRGGGRRGAIRPHGALCPRRRRRQWLLQLYADCRMPLCARQASDNLYPVRVPARHLVLVLGVLLVGARRAGREHVASSEFRGWRWQQQ